MDSLERPNLPDDIVIAIATQLRRQPTAFTSLHASSLVSRRFYILTRRILYANINLTEGTIGPFVHSFAPSTHCQLIKSLSVRFERSTYHDFWHPPTQDPDTERQLLEDIARLTRLMKRLTNLASFSFFVKGYAGTDIPRTTIISLLESLPQSCINLEIDVPPTSHTNMHEFGRVHVCDAVRQVLPRMQHVRLRLPAMCSSMFGTGDIEKSSASQDEDANREFNPISLPHIRTLMVNCSHPGGSHIKGCVERNRLTGMAYRHGMSDLAWRSVASGLEGLLARHGEALKDVVINLVVEAVQDNLGHLVNAMQRADMISKECWALPFFVLGRPFQQAQGQLLRLPDGSEFVLHDKDFEFYAEGLPWKNVVGGGRLPAEILSNEQHGRPSFATGCTEAPIETTTIGKWLEAEAPGGTPITWQNENQAGRKLYFPQKRTGSDYLSIRPIAPVLPSGWVCGRMGALERAEWSARS